MKRIIESERLFLREFNVSDSENLYRLNSDPEVIQYTGDVKFNSIKEAEIFIKNYEEYNKYGYGRWAVCLKSNEKFIGWCGLKFNEENLVDLGFRLFKIFWNRGFATEAAQACIDYGFSEIGLEKIIGRSLKSNLASIKVLQKAGMSFWKNSICHGKDECVYYEIVNQCK